MGRYLGVELLGHNYLMMCNDFLTALIFWCFHKGLKEKLAELSVYPFKKMRKWKYKDVSMLHVVQSAWCDPNLVFKNCTFLENSLKCW